MSREIANRVKGQTVKALVERRRGERTETVRVVGNYREIPIRNNGGAAIAAQRLIDVRLPEGDTRSIEIARIQE